MVSSLHACGSSTEAVPEAVLEDLGLPANKGSSSQGYGFSSSHVRVGI